MRFSSNDLPLSLTTPVTSGESSSERSTRLKSPLPHIRYPLVNSINALLLVTNTTLQSVVRKGDALLNLATNSQRPLHFINVVRAVPIPLLSHVSPQYFAESYRAALHSSASPFDLLDVSITLEQFVSRVVEHTNASNSVLVTAFIYMDRLVTAQPHLFLRSSIAHKIFAVAFMLAVKFHEDDYYTAHFFSCVLGIPIDELIELELLFIRAVDHRLFVTTEQFRDAQIALMSEAIDSSMGMSILHSLRQYEVADVTEASNAVKTWHVYPKNAYSRQWEYEAVEEEGRAMKVEKMGLLMEGARVETEETRLIVGELAKVQLQHDFPDLPARPYAGALQRQYTINGIVRFATLDLLAKMELVDDLRLPALELRPRAEVVIEMAKEAEKHRCIRKRSIMKEEAAGVKGFGSFLVNAPYIGSMYGGGARGRPALSGLGMWQYVPPEAKTGGIGGNGAAAPVIAGGLCLIPTIWSTSRR